MLVAYRTVLCWTLTKAVAFRYLPFGKALNLVSLEGCFSVLDLGDLLLYLQYSKAQERTFPLQPKTRKIQNMIRNKCPSPVGRASKPPLLSVELLLPSPSKKNRGFASYGIKSSMQWYLCDPPPPLKPSSLAPRRGYWTLRWAYLRFSQISTSLLTSKYLIWFETSDSRIEHVTMTALLGILPVAEQASWSLFRDRGAAGAESVFNPPEQGVDPTAGRGSLSQ